MIRVAYRPHEWCDAVFDLWLPQTRSMLGTVRREIDGWSAAPLAEPFKNRARGLASRSEAAARLIIEAGVGRGLAA